MIEIFGGFGVHLCNLEVLKHCYDNNILSIKEEGGASHVNQSYYISLMVITHSPLPQNNGNLPLPFFCYNYPIVLLYNIY